MTQQLIVARFTSWTIIVRWSGPRARALLPMMSPLIVRMLRSAFNALALLCDVIRVCLGNSWLGHWSSAFQRCCAKHRSFMFSWRGRSGDTLLVAYLFRFEPHFLIAKLQLGHDAMQFVDIWFGPLVQSEDAGTDALEVLLLASEQQESRRPSSRNRWCNSVSIAPEVSAYQSQKYAGTNISWGLFHVHTKPQFFEHSTFSFDLILQMNVVLILKHRLNRLFSSDLFNVVERRFHISCPFNVLSSTFEARQTQPVAVVNCSKNYLMK